MVGKRSGWRGEEGVVEEGKKRGEGGRGAGRAGGGWRREVDGEGESILRTAWTVRTFSHTCVFSGTLVFLLVEQILTLLMQ